VKVAKVLFAVVCAQRSASGSGFVKPEADDVRWLWLVYPKDEQGEPIPEPLSSRLSPSFLGIPSQRLSTEKPAGCDWLDIDEIKSAELTMATCVRTLATLNEPEDADQQALAYLATAWFASARVQGAGAPKVSGSSALLNVNGLGYKLVAAALLLDGWKLKEDPALTPEVYLDRDGIPHAPFVISDTQIDDDESNLALLVAALNQELATSAWQYALVPEGQDILVVRRPEPNAEGEPVARFRMVVAHRVDQAQRRLQEAFVEVSEGRTPSVLGDLLAAPAVTPATEPAEASAPTPPAIRIDATMAESQPTASSADTEASAQATPASENAATPANRDQKLIRNIFTVIIVILFACLFGLTVIYIADGAVDTKGSILQGCQRRDATRSSTQDTFQKEPDAIEPAHDTLADQEEIRQSDTDTKSDSHLLPDTTHEPDTEPPPPPPEPDVRFPPPPPREPDVRTPPPPREPDVRTPPPPPEPDVRTPPPPPEPECLKSIDREEAFFVRDAVIKCIALCKQEGGRARCYDWTTIDARTQSQPFRLIDSVRKGLGDGSGKYSALDGGFAVLCRKPGPMQVAGFVPCDQNEDGACENRKQRPALGICGQHNEDD
jgi:hypothetical protein